MGVLYHPNRPTEGGQITASPFLGLPSPREGRKGTARRKPCRVALRLNKRMSAAAYTGKRDRARTTWGGAAK